MFTDSGGEELGQSFLDGLALAGVLLELEARDDDVVEIGTPARTDERDAIVLDGLSLGESKEHRIEHSERALVFTLEMLVDAMAPLLLQRLGPHLLSDTLRALALDAILEPLESALHLRELSFHLLDACLETRDTALKGADGRDDHVERGEGLLVALGSAQ